MGVIKRILFQCPSDLQLAYKAPDAWFEVVGGDLYLKLFCTSAEYTPIRKGEVSEYQRLFRGVRVTPRLNEIGFNLALREDNIKYRFILEEISERSIASSYDQHIPVKCIDYISPDKKDYKEAIAAETELVKIEPFTVRYGLLNVDPIPGLAGESTDLYGTGGIKLTFTYLKQKLF